MVRQEKGAIQTGAKDATLGKNRTTQSLQAARGRSETGQDIACLFSFRIFCGGSNRILN